MRRFLVSHRTEESGDLVHQSEASPRSVFSVRFGCNQIAVVFLFARWWIQDTLNQRQVCTVGTFYCCWYSCHDTYVNYAALFCTTASTPEHIQLFSFLFTSLLVTSDSFVLRDHNGNYLHISQTRITFRSHIETATFLRLNIFGTNCNGTLYYYMTLLGWCNADCQ